MATTKNYLDYSGLQKYDDLLKKFVAGAYVAKENGMSLMTDAQATKLAGIAEGAQVNVIESISVKGNGGAVTKIEPTGNKGVTIDISAYALSSEVTTEVNRAKSAEASLGGRIDDLFTPAHDTTPASGSVVTYVNEKIADVNSAASTLAGRVKANEDAITLLNGNASTSGSVANTVSTEIAKVVAKAPAEFDTLKEIADWIANDKTGAAKMQADIAKLNGSETVEGSVAKALKDAKSYTDLETSRAKGKEEALAGRLDVIEGTGAGSIKKALEDAKAHTNGLVGEIPSKVGQTLTSTVVDYVNAKVAETASGELNTRLTAVEGKVGDASKGLVKDVADLKTTVGNSNSGLVKDVAANAAAISAVDGKVAAMDTAYKAADKELQAAIDAIKAIPLTGENSIASLFPAAQA